MKMLLLCITILLAGCAAAPAKGCGYARSQEKNLRKYHRQHKHHSK